MFMEACFLDGFLHAVSAFFYASFPAPIELGRIESLLLRQPPSQGKVICSIEFCTPRPYLTFILSTKANKYRHQIYCTGTVLLC